MTLKNSSRNKPIIFVLSSLAIISLMVGLFIYKLNRAAMVPNNADNSFSDYSQYLSYTKNDPSNVKVYLDPADYNDFNWCLTIYNNTDNFYCGRVRLTKDDNEVFTYKIINMKPQEVRVIGIDLAERPDDYSLEKSKFYSFTYPIPSAIAHLSKDSDKDYEYVWNNLLFEEEIDEEIVLEWAEYIYIQDVLAGQDSPDTYCYSPSKVTYYDVDGVSYPNVDSAVMGIVIDHDRNNIKIVDLLTEETLLEKEMK